MLYQLLIPLLLAVTVHGTQQGKAKKLRKQREKRKKAVRMLRTKGQNSDDVFAPSLSPSEESPLDEAEQQQSVSTAMAPSTAVGGMFVYLNQQGGGAATLEVPKEATVATLVAAAAGSGVDLSGRTLMFGGELLSDPSAPLSDIGVGAEAVIDVSRFVWNRQTLHELQPVFEAEVVVQGGVNQIIFLRFHVSTRRLKNTDCIEMQFLFPQSNGGWSRSRFDWTQAQRAVVEYLDLIGVVRKDPHNHADNERFIEVDASNHISVTESGNDIDLPFQCPLPGVTRPLTFELERWSVVLRRVASN